jgi:hypothetical protein
MSVVGKNVKNSNTNIVLIKQPIENGDLSKWLKDKIPKRLKPLSITQKKEKENKEYNSSINIIKKNQEKTEDKRQRQLLDNKNKNLNPSSIKRLPKTLKEIEENPDLVLLLLKEPSKMSEEEKSYIKSFSDAEFKLFAEFLKIKEKELSWRGNDWGSGHYLQNFVSIYRNSSLKENEKLLSLKNFLKMNHANYANYPKKAIHILQNNYTKNDEFILQYEERKTQDVIKNQTMNDMYETTSNNILKELEKFKNVILEHKNEIKYKQIKNQNEIIISDLERKTKLVREDVAKLKENKKDEIENLIDAYKFKMTQLSSKKESSIINKINDYLERMEITPYDLIKKMDKNSSITMEVKLDFAKDTLEKLKILDKFESEDFLNMVKNYHGDPVKIEYLLRILDAPHKQDHEENDDNAEDDSYEQNEFEEEYDYHEPDSPLNHRQQTNKNLGDFDYFMKRKSAIMIQKIFRAHNTRKEVFVALISRNMAAKRIQKQFKKYYQIIKLKKNEAAKKITYLFRKHYILKNINRKLSITTAKWLKEGKNLSDLPFSHKNRSKAALAIQRSWRRYKRQILSKFYDKKSSVMDINMLKTKTCLICLINRVTHLCKDVSYSLYSAKIITIASLAS